MQRFKSPGSAQRFLSVHAVVQNTFNVQRNIPLHAPRLPRRSFPDVASCYRSLNLIGTSNLRAAQIWFA
jgi:hypothetical protein